ncbi:hypothetical protein [uncultured Paraglaciecola sp.]|jgi:hypothetical protein|uniref:hypothetical protein n=1 Tax=uncultured Paraglaciecola sp. TaxID=1765024 RepID=UPI0025DEC45C|nr:hypothetical protein [uncultured Paraglaciecola sp.]
MKFKFYLRLCSHFLIATIFAFVLASLFHSQFVMAELTSVGVTISFVDRLSMSLDDLIGLYPRYGVVIAVSFLVAFCISALLLKRFKFPSSVVYFIGGGFGVATALVAMHPILDITLIAGARSTLGFISQSLAGAMGGWVFSHLRNARKKVA